MMKTRVVTADTSWSIAKDINGLTISGSVEMDGDDSYVRVMADEYLLFEANPLISEEMSFSFEDWCDETYDVKDKVRNIYVEINKAKLTITDINHVPTTKNRVTHADKISNINGKGLTWVANHTSVSRGTYKDWKKLTAGTKVPDWFKYYSGGIIVESSAGASSATVPDIDWRDINGVNYVTSVKGPQGRCGSCWAFAAIGALEACINIFVSHSNPNLSEQELVSSCCNAGDCGGGYPSSALAYIRDNGVSKEGTIPYIGGDSTCGARAPVAWITGYTQPAITDEDVLRTHLTNDGVLSSGIYNWSHAMALVGVKTVQIGDRFWYRGPVDYSESWQTIEEGHPLIGHTVWIFKNSWGQYYGDHGYVYVESFLSQIGWTCVINRPITYTAIPLPTVITQNISVELDANGTVSIVAADIDNGSYDSNGIASMSVSPSAFTCNDIGTNTVTLSVTNTLGGTATNIATVNVVDSIAPAAIAKDITVTIDKSGSAVITADMVNNGSTDNCSIKSMSVTPNIFTSANVGANAVTLTVTDIGGNSGTAICTVTVQAYAPPIYCDSFGNNSVIIDKNTFNKVNPTSSGEVYLSSGSTVTGIFSSSSSGKMYWRGWIDYDGDGVFETLVFSYDNKKGDIRVRFTAPTTSTKMRVTVANKAVGVCDTGFAGQSIDYELTIT